MGRGGGGVRLFRVLGFWGLGVWGYRVPLVVTFAWKTPFQNFFSTLLILRFLGNLLNSLHPKP